MYKLILYTVIYIGKEEQKIKKKNTRKTEIGICIQFVFNTYNEAWEKWKTIRVNNWKIEENIYFSFSIFWYFLLNYLLDSFICAIYIYVYHSKWLLRIVHSFCYYSEQIVKTERYRVDLKIAWKTYFRRTFSF